MIGLIVRFIVSAIVLMLVSFLLPGFATLGFGAALAAAIVIAILGFIVESVFGKKISPHNRGIVGFVVAALVIYLRSEERRVVNQCFYQWWPFHL